MLFRSAGRGAVSTSLISFLAEGTRGAVLGDDVWDTLRNAVNSMPTMAVLGGAAGAALGKPGAKEVKPAGEPTKVEAPPVDPRLEQLRQDFQGKMAEAKTAEAPTGEVAAPAPGVPTGEPSWVAEQRAKFGELSQNPDFGNLVFFLLDGKKGTSPQRADAAARANEIIAANPQGNISDFVSAAMKPLADRIAPSVPPGPGLAETMKTAAEGVQADQSAASAKRIQDKGTDVGIDSKTLATAKGTPDAVQLGEIDRYVVLAMLERVKGGEVGQKIFLEGGETGRGGDVTVKGFKTGKPSWMNIEGKEYYDYPEVIKVLKGMLEGELPKEGSQARRARIAEQILEALRTDAEKEKATALGGLTTEEAKAALQAPEAALPPEQQAGRESDITAKFNAALDQAIASQPPPAEAGLSDWQRSMVDKAEQIEKTPPEAPPVPPS